MKLILNNGVELELVQSIITGSYAIDGVSRNSLIFKPQKVTSVDELEALLIPSNLQKITYQYDNTYTVYYDYTLLANIRQERDYNDKENGITTVTLAQMTNTEKSLAQMRADIDFIAIMQEVPL
jgi:hypothetical protein